jgi:hypothetical protein
MPMTPTTLMSGRGLCLLVVSAVMVGVGGSWVIFSALPSVGAGRCAAGVVVLVRGR